MTDRGPLPLAQLGWTDGAPIAEHFGDIYFNPDDGVAETRHVFLDGTNLPARWEGNRIATVGELGFGTGLNFLATWALWEQARSPRAHLHYVSIEGCPLTPEQLSIAHKAFPEFAHRTAQLREAYPPRARGHHLIRLSQHVTLRLLFGDAAEMLKGLEARIETWFLDGFAPSKNPEVWSSEVMAQLARCSAEGARLATFTVAGDVRRALSEHGFEVEKSLGFGQKREMLKARFVGEPAIDPAPWFHLPLCRPGRRVAVIGGGIAGASCAQALHRYGCSVTVFDQGSRLGSGASGAPSGLVLPRLSAEPDAPARFNAAAFHMAVRAYQAEGVLSRGGGLRLASGLDKIGRLERTATSGLFDADDLELLEDGDASDKAGCNVTSPALFFANAGQLRSSDYLKAAIADIAFHFDTAIAGLERDEDDEMWRLIKSDGDVIGPFDTVILACGVAAATLFPHAEWPIEARHGQLTKIETAVSLALPVSFGGYAAPTEGGTWIGATHTPIDRNADPGFDPHADEDNLARLANALPELRKSAKIIDRWFGIRATTPDQLPIVGPITDAESFRQAFAPLVNGQTHGLAPAPVAPGLFVVSALGSRGFVSGPLLGEVIAAYVLGTPLPIDREARQAIHPARFTIRRLKRGDS